MTTANVGPQPTSARQGLLAHPLNFFFGMAYAWLAWSPWHLSEFGVGLLPFEREPVSACSTSPPWL